MSTIDNSQESPESKLTDVLWKIGMEQPDLRLAIAKCVSFLTKDTRGEVNQILGSALGSKITNFCKQEKISQKQFSDRVGIDDSAISRIVSGKTKRPSRDTIEKLKTVLGDF